jgi:hypothetical protein
MIGCLLKYSVYLKTYLVRELMRMLDDLLFQIKKKNVVLIFLPVGSIKIRLHVRNFFCAVSQSTVSRYITQVGNAVNQSAN